MKNKSLFSIITPIYNRLEWLPLTLNSLRSQTYKNFEIIAINDCGDDPTQILNDYPDLNIKYIEHEVNKGLASSRNTGLKNCSGDYIIFLDHDDSLMPLSLEFRLSMIKKYNAEIVYTRCLKDIYDRKKMNDGNEIYVPVRSELYWSSGFDRDLILIQNISPCNGVTFSRKSWMESESMLDEELHTGEDFSFWQGLSRKFDFIELKLIDANCSFRLDGSQMTGSRNFSLDFPRIYKKYRHTAKNLEYVTNAQNEILKRVGINPEDYDL
jgi:glycosyltransferase involved in cell wall biosynthesis